MKNLYQEDSDSLIQEGRLIFGNGDILFAEGDPSHYLYLIKSGKVLLVKEENMNLKKIEIMGKKDIIGLNSLIIDKEHEYTSVSIGRVEVIKIKKSEVKGILGKCEPWVMDLMKVICDRLNKTSEVLESHNLLEKNNFQNDESIGLTTEEIYNSLDDYRKKKEKV